MARKFYTSDLHLGMTLLVEKGLREFSSVEKMNSFILKRINARCTEDDILISLGDFCSFGKDRDSKSLKIPQRDYVSQMNPTVVNIEGNHDPKNRVKSIGSYLRTTLGRKFTSVSCSHYPSTDPRAYGMFRRGDIHLHGHIHKGEKFIIDYKHKVLNVNLACDIWRFCPVSEDELMVEIESFMRRSMPEFWKDRKIIV